MWHKEKIKNPVVRLALLIALASTPMMANLFKSDYVLAQARETPSFPLPNEVEDGTKIRIDGSASMTRANQALKQSFENKFSGTNVEIATNGTEAALKALEEGEIDIAAIGRGLTPEEEEKLGLEQQRLHREKIAIIVGKDNPFKGDLKNDIFTKIYRGEITNWSQIGGPSGKIRVIDRPEMSDTREAFRNYPLFNGNLDTGSTATKLDSDDPAEVIKGLGNDGIGFVLANQVAKLGDNVRVLSMHKVLPDNPKYPYSQPLVYVFKKNPSVAVRNFVGYATANPGQEALKEARDEEATAVATSVAGVVSQAPEGIATTAETPGVTPEATPGATPEATPGATTTADGQTAQTGEETASSGTNADGTDASNGENVGNVRNTTDNGTNREVSLLPDGSTAPGETIDGTIPWWWILLPVAAIGALALWWLLGRRKSQEDDTVARGVLPEDSAIPFTPTSTSTTGPVKEPEPVENNPVESSTGVNTVVEPPNPSGGVNQAGIAAGAAGVAAALGAAALSSKKDDSEETPEVRDNFVAETSSQLQAEAPDLQQTNVPSAGLDIEVPDLQQTNVPSAGLDIEAPDLQQPNAPSAGLDIEAPDLSQPDISADVESNDWQPADIPDTSLDLEAPAAVVNASFPSLPRINTPTDGDVPPVEPVVTDTPPEENSDIEGVPQEELPSASTNNWLGNFATGAAAAGAAAAIGAEKIKSQLAGKDKDVPAEDKLSGDETNESAEISGTTSYPQLPDVWEGTQSEQIPQEEVTSNLLNLDSNDTSKDSNNDVTSPSDLWGTPEDENPTLETTVADSSLLNRDENQSDSEVEQPLQTSPSDLWGTPQTEQPNTEEVEEEESSSFSLGGAAAAVGAVGAAGAAIGSQLFNRDGDTSEDSNKTEENPVSEEENASSKSGLAGGWFLNRFRKNTPETTENTETPEIAAEQPQTTEETPGLPEVRIINPNEEFAEVESTATEEQPTANGLPNVWVTPSNPQQDTPEETPSDSEEKVAQFGASSTSGDNLGVGAAVAAGAAAVGAFALGSQPKEEESQDQDRQPATSQTLDEIANQAEIDTEIPESQQKVDAENANGNQISGVQVNGTTGLPLESSISLTNRTPKWAYASWNISPADREIMHNQGANQLVLRLYDVTGVDLSYQNAKLVQQYECEETVAHRYVAIPNTERDYVTEIGYITKNKEWLLVSRSPIVRVFNRPHQDFWFEADAELIIHGATEPGSTVTIDGQSIKVKQDGTFHLRVPFTESLLNYLITAVAPDTEQAKTIHMQFSQKDRENS